MWYFSVFVSTDFGNSWRLVKPCIYAEDEDAAFETVRYRFPFGVNLSGQTITISVEPLDASNLDADQCAVIIRDDGPVYSVCARLCELAGVEWNEDEFGSFERAVKKAAEDWGVDLGGGV